MELKYEERLVCVVDYNDLDSFLTKVYNRGFNCAADQEWGNDSDHEIFVTKEELDKWQLEDLSKFMSGQHVEFILHTLLADCANKGLIEEGNYLINVCW